MNIKRFEEFNELNEDTSATGGVSVSGAGAVVSANPSTFAGATIGTNWSSGGGTKGSGDVGVPFNAGGPAMQKIPVSGRDHGPRTGKKNRKPKLDMKSLKDIFSKKQDYTAKQGEVERQPKIMSFDDFYKNDITNIKK
jgi:hypothetical protein